MCGGLYAFRGRDGGQQRLTVEVACQEATKHSYCIPLTVSVPYLTADPVKPRPKVKAALLLIFDLDLPELT